ncbi:MAG: Heat shock protein 60 family co-chaperone GroES [Candidatus Ozemobacter sibiricus]|jgi:chaperonin GroES|uniref:Co-chaperonin GroES n=1 Tax=Candidatus Ozemobacter sibiricus TaxID=2268124 RepID=A0A367ZLX8_9BACT|nr:MAG: Heat shock protein 60 family co-chaperone GroES [Candidatus Ozemobacter sibiricus]
MNLKPLNDRVIVKPKEALEKSKGGVILPDTASKEKPIEGKVIAVGPGKMTDNGNRIPLEVKKDQNVIFSKYSGTEIKIDDENYLILREEDILAIIN